MTVNRDLAYPRTVLALIMDDLRREIEKNPAYKDEGLERIAACQLGIKIFEMFENYDSVEFGDTEPPTHINGA